MKTKTALSLLALSVPAAAQHVPAYDADWIGYDTGQADQVRWPWNFRSGDLDGDGDLDYAVAQGASIPGLTLHFNQGSGTFGDPVVLPSSTGGFWDDVQDVELVDLDGDGDLDAVVSNPGAHGFGAVVAVHENRGDGTFEPFVQHATGEGPVGVASADLDGDGSPDVVTANWGYIGQGDTISVLLNDGDGGLLAPLHVPVGESPRRVAAGDLDGDGLADLAVALEDETVVVLLNQGGATFSSRSYEVFPSANAGTLHAAVELGDLDGDGDLDIAYTSMKCGFGSFAGDGAVGLLHNDGDGVFDAPVELATVPESQGGVELALADWNGDGDLDVASAHEFDGEWLLFESDGEGGYLPAQAFGAASSAIAVDGADVTGDGLPELVVLGRASLELCVHRNPGGAAFAKNPVWPFLLTQPSLFDPIVADGLDAADVDGDGDLDLGTAYHDIQGLDGGQSVLLNAGDGTFPETDLYETPTGAANFTFADLDGDGAPDMLSTDATQGSLRRRLNAGDGSFGAESFWPFISPTALDPGDLEAFDVDGDGDLDAFAVSGSTLAHRRNDGGGDFTEGPFFHELTTFGGALAHGDLDADGDEDVVTNTSFIGIETSLGNGDGTFQAPFGAMADWGVKGIVLADLDLDGFLDAATSSWSDGDHGHPTVQVLLGWGDGSFALPQTYLGSHQQGTSSNAGDIVATDADGDGDLDLATGNYWSLDVSYFENRGDGTFEPQVRYGTGGTAYGTVAGDFDGDGVEDVAVGVTVGPAIDFHPGAVVLPSTAGGAWKDLGFGLAGATGVPALLFVGFDQAFLPLFGGTVVPSLDLLLPLATDGAGAASLTTAWPSGLTPGFTLYGQAGVLDPAAPQDVALSNALSGTQH